MRRRIWSEFLPAAELGAPATVALLARYGLEPLVAMPPGAETPELAAALRALSRAGVPLGLWPLMSDAEGYWPSEHNAEAFVRRVGEVRAFAAASGVPIATVAIDLEPPLDQIRPLLDGPAWRSAALLARRARAATRRDNRLRRRDAVTRLGALAAELHAAGIETLAAIVPHVVFDLAAGVRVWQAVLRTPVDRPGWSAISAMFYSSMLIQRVPATGEATARALIYEGARALVSALDTRASLSLGLVGAGKLGDEAVLASPAALRGDVEAALAAGVSDLALFSLEGVLARRAPEDWLAAFTAAEPRLPTAPRDRALRGVFRVARAAGTAASRVLGRPRPRAGARDRDTRPRDIDSG